MLETALQRGDITFDDYIELYPDSAMPFKAQLKEIRKKKLLPPEISQKIMANPQLLQVVMQLVAQSEALEQQNQQIQAAQTI